MNRYAGILAAALLAFITSDVSLSAADKPSLVVVVIADQMRADRLEKYGSLMSGGLRMLLDNGRQYTRCAHSHSGTETGPGHATLLSGLTPRHHGIILNDWHDTETHALVYCVENPHANASPNFDTPSGSVSPDNLKGENLADLIKRSNRKSKVYAVAGKDRSAVLTAGHKPDGAFWYNRSTGGFTSNPSIVESLPEWGKEFWDTEPMETVLYRRNIPDEWSHPERPEALPDGYPYESNNNSRTSPHPVLFADEATIEEAREKKINQLFESPWIDWLTLQLAMRVLDQEDLGRDAAPDLLVVSLSGFDTVGHRYGPDSQEYLDALIRVDSWLAEFMNRAQAAAGAAGGAIFAFSSDHGVQSLPETLEGGRRIDPRGMRERFLQQLQERLAPDSATPIVEAFESFHVYLDRRTMASNGVSLDRAIETARSILSDYWEIARVYRSADLSSPTGGDTLLEIHRDGYDPDRGGDLVLQPCRNCLVTSSGTGTTHGTPYDYDRQVPMIIMGPGIANGTDAGECRTIDLVPTLADILGMKFSDPRDGKALSYGGVE